MTTIPAGMTPSALVQARHALKLSQVELAAFLDVSPYTVSRWERGKAPVPSLVASVLGALVDVGADKRGWLFHYLQERASLRVSR